jgi:hypothetical protein
MSGSGPTRRIEDWKPLNPGKDDRGGAGNDPTRHVDAPGGERQSPGAAAGSGPKTIMAGAPLPAGNPPPQGGPPQGLPGQPAPSAAPVNFLSDPVVGWLVVTKGPGKGAGLRLGPGMNSVGRDESNRVAINFGDNSISRDKHCIVTYEPKRRVYYIQNEGGTNLTYVGDAVVLQAQQLHNGEIIQIGGTELRFVALCGEDFSWDEKDG